jgi:drug/metabolite transporter (DMT)-like permease
VNLSGKGVASPSGVPVSVAATCVLTLVALSCFAANSLLCRLALGDRWIGPGAYSAVRLASGAAFLAPLALSRGGGASRGKLLGSPASAAMLFLYAIPFSYAYRTLGAGTGAFVLFAAVQVTMLASALVAGERPRPVQWIGLLLALGGLAYLVRPGISAPGPAGAALMVLAGVAWGIYSLRGRRTTAPIAETAGNFLRASIPAAVVGGTAIARGSDPLSGRGVALAIVSGAIASGAGYAVWYAALRGLTATRAAVIQLAVPVIAAAGGVVFLHERVTPRLLVASIAILGGVALAAAVRIRPASVRKP